MVYNCFLTLWDFVVWNMALARTLMTSNFKASFSPMFCASPLHSSAPCAPRTGLHLMAHQRYSFGFRYAKLVFDGIERRAILPSHFNDTINLSLGKILRYFGTFHLPGCFQSLCTKNLIYPKKFAPRAEDPSHGAKNGKRIGIMWNIAANAAIQIVQSPNDISFWKSQLSVFPRCLHQWYKAYNHGRTSLPDNPSCNRSHQRLELPHLPLR